MKKDPNIAVIVQARTGSTRFPSKILQLISGKTVLMLMLERVQYSKYGKNVIVATTDEEEDNVIFELCRQNNIKCFRGNPIDLLDRHFKSAVVLGADIAVKIPSDCPLIDPSIIDKVVDCYIENQDNYDFVSNLHPPTYPDGNDVEVMSMKTLERAWKEAEKPFEREHTTPYIWDNPDKFRIGNVEWETGLNYSMSHRWTLDYPADYDFIKAVYEELYEDDPFFGLNDILALLEQKPGIKQINYKYAGINWYRHHINDLKTITPDQTQETVN
ncbi:MAG TPA: glycosyltransferase family protein [Ignavibacteria bacterium]